MFVDFQHLTFLFFSFFGFYTRCFLDSFRHLIFSCRNTPALPSWCSLLKVLCFIIIVIIFVCPKRNWKQMVFLNLDKSAFPELDGGCWLPFFTQWKLKVVYRNLYFWLIYFCLQIQGVTHLLLELLYCSPWLCFIYILQRHWFQLANQQLVQRELHLISVIWLVYSPVSHVLGNN